MWVNLSVYQFCLKPGDTGCLAILGWPEMARHLCLGTPVSPHLVAQKIALHSTHNCARSFPGSNAAGTFDVTPRAVYVASCRRHGVVPASYFLRHMHDAHLDMKHHGLGPSGVRPVAVALVVSTAADGASVP